MVSMLTHAVNSKTCADGSLQNSLFPLKDCSWNHLSVKMSCVDASIDGVDLVNGVM